jgi:hypothetical protein
MNTRSSKQNESKNIIAAIAAPDGTTSTTAKSSTASESTIVNLNVPSATVGVVVDATWRAATSTSAKSTKV